MAFAINDRVRVTDQHNQYRGKTGTVVRVVGITVYVHLDGAGSGGIREVSFLSGSLGEYDKCSPLQEQGETWDAYNCQEPLASSSSSSSSSSAA